MEPRDYQVKALNKLYAELKVKQNVLLTAIMGAGKTFLSCKLIQRLYSEKPDMNFIVLAHKQELVEQFEQSFHRFTKVPHFEIGLCCAGLNQRDIKKRITIGTIQTFINIIDNHPGAGLIVIDEAHRVDINSESQYKQAIDYLRLQRPNCRILGITATPARLGHGYIYGRRCKPGSVNLFDDVSHKIRYEELKEAGYLVPLRGEVANHERLESDLSGVSVHGDYVLDQLGEIMSRSIHLHTAVDAIQQYCSGYKRICVFCCTIDHAEKLREMIGDEATTVHSQLGDMERFSNMDAWKSGVKRIITSVNILTEGFDMPILDCLVFARPTLSSSLYLQAVGRVLRPYPGKDHGFLVDLTDNTARFGTDLDNVRITVPKAVSDAEKKEKVLWKICPECDTEVHVALRECSDCGFQWPEKECVIADALPDMKSVVFEREPPEIFDVDRWAISSHTSKKNGKLLGKVDYFFSPSMYIEEKVSLFLCFSDFYEGYAVKMSQNRWGEVSGDEFPESVEEFLREKKLYEPKQVEVDMNDKWPKLVSVMSDKETVRYIENGQVYDDICPF